MAGDLAEAIKAARMKKKLSLRQVASKVQVSKSTWQRVESGQQDPPGKSLLPLCRLFPSIVTTLLEEE